MWRFWITAPCRDQKGNRNGFSIIDRNRKELGSRNVEWGMEKNSEYGIRKQELKKKTITKGRKHEKQIGFFYINFRV